MRAEIRIIVDVDSERQASRIRDTIVSAAADHGVEALGASSLMTEQAFTVTGVDVETREPFQVVVRAESETAAEESATSGQESRVVAKVEEQGPAQAVGSQPEPEPPEEPET